MRNWILALGVFMLLDCIPMAATPYDYRKDYPVRVMPGGGLYAYLKYMAEK